MNNDKPTGKLPTAREILRGRKFGLKDALSHEASGVLKGASPIAAHEQAIFGIRALLEKHILNVKASRRTPQTPILSLE